MKAVLYKTLNNKLHPKRYQYLNNICTCACSVDPDQTLARAGSPAAARAVRALDRCGYDD